MSFLVQHPAAVALAFTVVYLVLVLRELVRTRAYATEQKAAADARISDLEKRLIDTQSRYDSLVDLSGIGVLVLDSAGVILRANSNAAEWLHTSVSSMVGHNVLEVSLSLEMETLLEHARHTGCIRRELRVGDMHLIVTIAPVETTLERKRFLMIMENVTQLRRLELIRRDFVANVSHELRTPLTSIRALAETLQQAPLQERETVERFLGMIVTESERLTRISDDLLVLSSAESRPPQKTKVDLGELLTGLVNRFQRQASNAGIPLSLQTEGNLTVQVNRDQIEQVIVNLVDNAIKYSHAGGTVRVTAESRNDAVYVHVSDTGIGIMQQDLSRIFERFYRVDKARSRETGGTGLGLSIVKHIIEAHGGQVTVDSEFNRGSTFTISLPHAESTAGADYGTAALG